jgi:phthiodiolone/phenolphthiodiolone dimycocerosates ketoreductase
VSRSLTTGLPFDNHRSTPIAAIGAFAQLLGRANVDYLWMWDEYSGWFPGNLWRPDNTPMAQIMEPNSTYDPFLLAASALAHNPDIGVRISTDAIRSAPAELLRKMLTLANATTGKVVCALGSGELRQTKPFGYKRAEGLKRLEDVLKLTRRLYDEPGPWSESTNFWDFQNATIGHERPQIRPEFWALGGGPALLDIAARYADGLEVAAPQTQRTPEEFAELVNLVRGKVAQYGRDPNAFGFGVWSACVCHEDPDMIDRVLDNPLIRYFAGMFGRLDHARWADDGETPLMPAGWHYALKWAPFEQSDDEVNRIAAAVPQSMARKAFHVGTPDDMVKLHRSFIDAGADFVGIADMGPLVLGLEEGAASTVRLLDVLSQLKPTAHARSRSITTATESMRR